MRGRPRLKYTKALKKRIKVLYLRGFNYLEIAKRIKKCPLVAKILMNQLEFSDSDFEFALKELERVNERYDRLVDYTLPLERFLEKKARRLQNLFKRHNRFYLYGSKDVIKKIKKEYLYWRK